MRKTRFEEKQENSAESFFDNNLFNEEFQISNQVILREKENTLLQTSLFKNEILSDKFLTSIKLIFLYLPGAIAIQLAGFYLISAILLAERMQVSWFALSEIAIVGMFLTMLGVGKLDNLKYLKVPATIFAFSAFLWTLEAVFTLGTGISLPEIFRVVSLIFPIILGFQTKKSLDEN